jgi:hypothetical protein
MRRSIDTSVEIRRRQLEAYRAMTPEARLRLAAEMSADVRSLARSGIRARGLAGAPPDLVEAELARILLGPELAATGRIREPLRNR